MADTKDLIYKLEINAVECESPKSDEAASATFLREWAMIRWNLLFRPKVCIKLTIRIPGRRYKAVDEAQCTQ